MVIGAETGLGCFLVGDRVDVMVLLTRDSGYWLNSMKTCRRWSSSSSNPVEQMFLALLVNVEMMPDLILGGWLEL